VNADVVSLLPEYLKKFYLRIIFSFKEIEDALEPNEKYKASYAKKSVSHQNIPEDGFFISISLYSLGPIIISTFCKGKSPILQTLTNS